jgi:hypothetical protein
MKISFPGSPDYFDMKYRKTRDKIIILDPDNNDIVAEFSYNDQGFAYLNYGTDVPVIFITNKYGLTKIQEPTDEFMKDFYSTVCYGSTGSRKDKFKCYKFEKNPKIKELKERVEKALDLRRKGIPIEIVREIMKHYGE